MMDVRTTLGLIEIMLIYTLPLNHTHKYGGYDLPHCNHTHRGVNSPMGVAPPLVVPVLLAVARQIPSGYVAVHVWASVLDLTPVMAPAAGSKTVSERLLSAE